MVRKASIDATFNSLWSSDAIALGILVNIDSGNEVKKLPEAKLTFCQLYPHEQIPMEL